MPAPTAPSSTTRPARAGRADSTRPGTTRFVNNASAGSGGRIRFAGTASGGAARLLRSTGTGVGTSTGTGGELDISALTGSGTSTGSIEGGGSVSLGSKTLTVGSNGLGSTFSGVIADGGVVPGSGGSLTVIGAGRLTLTGANTYSGATHIGDGISANSGKLVVANLSGSATGSGAVFVERGGTLAGSGLIAGPVTLRAGGTIAPGDPVTLTLRSSLTWDGGGVIRLVLGADSAGSDHLDVGSLLRGSSGTSGSFMFDLVDAGIVAGASYDLVDAGIVAGASYDLLRIGSLVGFAPTDFTFSGAAGSFAFDSTGALAFTAAAVPEPASAALLALGLGVLGVSFGAARWRVSPPPARGAARPAPVPSHA